jgi:hypothetical protein
MKITSFMSAFFITGAAAAQRSVYTFTANDLRSPVKIATFSVAVMPAKIGTAFRLIVQNPEKKKTEVKINHRELGLLADTSFTDEQFACRYNFDQVEDGHIQVTIISGKGKVTKDIEINTVTRRQVVIR